MDVVLLGSGNVATHLGLALAKGGHRIVQVYSRTLGNASLLANQFQAVAIDDITQLVAQADVFILAVNDDAIESVVGKLPLDIDGLVVHTSGTTAIDVLSPLGRYGVFYPLQTFSKSKEVDFRAIPIALESHHEDDMAVLESLAHSISDVVFHCDSAQRLTLHIAAVFACNFTNHLFAVAADLLQHNGLSFDLVKPLVMETAEKILTLDPAEAQTGPAVRDDRKTMEKHLSILREHPNWQHLYQLLSADIQRNKY